jgi:hypothetical protein
VPASGRHPRRRAQLDSVAGPPGLSISGGTEVSQIRFVTTSVGYLFGAALYQTEDGGRTWRRVPSPPVEALEASAGTVIRVVYDHGGCPGPCTQTVQETTAGSGAWHTLPHIRSPNAYGGLSAQSDGVETPLVGHYELTPGERDRAVKNGAKTITTREHKKMLRQQAAPFGIKLD